MDDDFGEDKNELVSQMVKKIVLQVITAVVGEKNNSFKAQFVYTNERKEEKILKEERYKQKLLGIIVS